MIPALAPLSPDLANVAASLQALSGLPQSWDANSFAELLSLPGMGGGIAMNGDDPVGLVLWRIAADEGEILTLCVIPRHRRSGIGRFLLEQAAIFMRNHDVRVIFLEVAVDNAAAIGLYGREGYREEGRRIAYYKTTSGALDALILAKRLL